MPLMLPPGFEEIRVIYATAYLIIFDRRGDCWMWIKESGIFGFSKGNHGPTSSSCSDMQKIAFANQAKGRQLMAWLADAMNASESPAIDDPPELPPDCPILPNEPPAKVAPGPGNVFAGVGTVHLVDSRQRTDIGPVADTDRGRIKWDR